MSARPRTYHSLNDASEHDDLFATPHSQLSPSDSTLSSHQPSNPSATLLDKQHNKRHTNKKANNNSSSSSDDNKSSTIGQAGIPALTFTLSNTILGAGVLGIAHAFSTAGFILGFALLLFAAASSAFGLHLLSQSARKLDKLPASFYTVAKGSIPAATAVIDAAVAIKCFGVAVSYLIVIGDLMPTAATTIYTGEGRLADWLDDRRVWITLFLCCIAGPLACFRSLNALRFTSTISILFISALSIIITLYGFLPSYFDPCPGADRWEDCKGNTYNVALDWSTLKVFPVFIFAFTCAQNIFTVHNELKDNTPARVTTVIGNALGMALFFYTIVSSFAYHTYGDLVNGNVLLSYPSTRLLAVIRAIIAVNVAFTFPLQILPCRSSVWLLIYQFTHRGHGDHVATRGDDDDDDADDDSDTPPKAPWHIHLLLTAALCGAAFVIAFFVSDLGVVLSVVGATGSTLISYILPGLFYNVLHRDEGWSVERVGAAVLCGWGMIVVPLCLFVIFMGGSAH